MTGQAFPLLALMMLMSGCATQQARVSGAGSATRLDTTAKQLLVDDKPWLALGGELGNSTASDPAVLQAALDQCQRMHLNTVMLPVYWDRIEPTENQFDFSLVQAAIDQARARNIHLVYLWFGTWKNSMSCYAPSWVKRDTTRFERVKRINGEIEEIISPLSEAANDADAKAFGRLLRWTRQYDQRRNTVIMAQVENEIGMIPEARDHSELAEAAYRATVPKDLLDLLTAGKAGPEVAALWEKAGRHDAGSWSDVFGTTPQADEVFSAWLFSNYVEKVAAAGKGEYALPMYANAALMRPGYVPGQYPSAGPLPHLLEVWRAGAPSLDMICPDIYFPSFIEWSGRYTRNGNPLFIPEMAPSMRATGNAVYAAAHFGAIGFGPFAIENVDAAKEKLITSCYSILSGMAQHILTAQRDQKIIGLSPQIGFDWSVDSQPQRGELGGVSFQAVFDRPATSGEGGATTLPTLGSGRWDAPAGTPLGAAMIIQLEPEEFAVVGMGVTLTFSPKDGQGKVGIETVQEGNFANEAWVGGRWLNGDETHQGRHIHFDDGRWSVQRVKLYRY